LGLRHDPQPSFNVAGCADEEILQFHFSEATIATSASAVSASQFADRAFDSITLPHPLIKLRTLLVAAPLQKFVILTDDYGAMSLSGGHTL
jgi:hypothetical protein